MSEFEKSEKMEKEKIGKETALVSPFGCRTGKNTYLRMLVFALFMLAAVGFLSSCGTSGKSKAPEEDMTTTPTTPTDPTPPVVVTPEPPRSPYEVLVQGQNKAKDAAANAKMAKKDAMTYSGKITAVTAGGDSVKAMANAQKVLDSRGNIEMYLKDAQTARKELVDAKANADEAAMLSLDTAIKEIDGYIATIQTILDEEGSETLADSIEKVAGTGKEPKMAAMIGQEVAKKIFDALEPKGIATGLNVEDVNTEPGVAVKTDVRDDNHLGKTWEAIVGSNNVMETRIAMGATGTEVVSAASVDGASVAIDSDNTVLPNACTAADNTRCTDGYQHDVSWKGVDGKIFCQGKDCGLTGSDTTRALTGSWYFTSDNPETYYQKDSADRNKYKPEVYAEYGYWLVDGTDLVHTFSRVVNEPDTLIPGKWADDDDLKTEATYLGNAIGLYDKFSGSGDNRKYQSGHFSADVELNAVFGDPSDDQVSGVIDNFRDANDNMIDSSWSVDLEAIETISNGVGTGGGVTDTGVRTSDGVWTSHSIGVDENSRPHTIHGTFNAHFSNGDAAGAYATRKE